MKVLEKALTFLFTVVIFFSNEVQDYKVRKKYKDYIDGSIK